MKCYVEHALDTLNAINNDIVWWTNLSIAIQIAIFIFGIITTIMIALQGDSNKHWTRPVGIITTALVTGLTTAVVQFHIPDNIDKLIDIYGGIAERTNRFETEASGINDSDLNKNPITTAYANDFNKLKLERFRIRGTAGRLNINQAQQMKPEVKQ